MADYKKIRIVDQSGTQLEEVNVKDEQARNDLEKKVLYYQNQAVSVATSAQIMRIPASGTSTLITTNTVVLECTFADPANIVSDVTWTSYAGYITFTGTCTAATTANVVLGSKSN